MNKIRSQRRAGQERRLERLGRLLGEKVNAGRLPRILDIGVGLAAVQITQAENSIRRAAQATLARKRAEALAKRLRRR